MDLVYEWMKNLVFYSLLVSIVTNVMPNSEYQKYIRFFLGMLLIVVAVTPVLKVLNLDETMDTNYFSRSLEKSWNETMEEVEIEMEVGP